MFLVLRSSAACALPPRSPGCRGFIHSFLNKDETGDLVILPGKDEDTESLLQGEGLRRRSSANIARMPKKLTKLMRSGRAARAARNRGHGKKFLVHTSHEGRNGGKRFWFSVSSTELAHEWVEAIHVAAKAEKRRHDPMQRDVWHKAIAKARTWYDAPSTQSFFAVVIFCNFVANVWEAQIRWTATDKVSHSPGGFRVSSFEFLCQRDHDVTA